MSPATDHVLPEGLTCSKTIIRLHFGPLSPRPAPTSLAGSRNPINKQGRTKTTDFVMISAAERNRAAALSMMEKFLNSHPLLPVC